MNNQIISSGKQYTRHNSTFSKQQQNKEIETFDFLPKQGYIAAAECARVLARL